MKKFVKVLALVTMVTVAVMSCNNKEQVIPEKEGVHEIVFALGSGEATRALIGSDENGKFAIWEYGDQLGTITTEQTGVFSGYSKITTASGSSPATFKIYSKDGLALNDKIYVWYPLNWSDEQDPAAVWFEIPSQQKYTSAGFDFDAMPMVTKEIVVDEDMVSSSTTQDVTWINMANMGSLLDFKVFSTNSSYASEKVESVTFTADKAIAGVFEKNLTSVDPAVESTMGISGFLDEDTDSGVDAPSSSIKTDMGGATAIGTSKDNALDVYMVVAPGEYTGSVVVKTDVTSYTFTISSAKTFVRSGLKAFGLDLNKGVRSKLPQTLSFTPDNVIAVIGQTFTAPTLGGVLSTGNKTWSSSNESVATVDSEGAVTLVAAGTTTITVNVAADNIYEAASAQYTLTVKNAGEVWRRINNVNDLEAGMTIIITDSDAEMGMGADKGNNRDAVSITSTDNGATVTIESEVQEVKLEKSGGNWLLNVGENAYLYAASSNSNYLKTASLQTAGDNGKWAISFSGNAAVIKAQGSNSRNLLRYNSSSKLFSCYSSGQQAISIYTNAPERTWELTGIALNTENVKKAYYVGETFDATNLVVTAQYQDASDGTVTKEEVVTNYTVSPSGALALTDEAVTISFGGKSQQIPITVTKRTPSLVVTPSSLSLIVEDTKTISVSGSDGAVTLTSNNTGVVTIDGMVVTAVGAGETTISVQTAETDNYLAGTASINVTVSEKGAKVVYVLTISNENFNSTSYAANNNEKTSTAVGKTDNTKTMEVKWTSNQVMLQSSAMQWQKNNGLIYNSTDLGTIKSVTVNSTAGTFTTYYGTAAQPSTNTTVGGGYFQTKVGDATGKTTSIVVEFEK